MSRSAAGNSAAVSASTGTRAGRSTGRGVRGPAAAAIVATAFVVVMLGATLPTPLYPIYQQRLGFGGLLVTVVFAAYAVGVALALVLFGRLSDQVGRRAVLLPGLVLAAVSSAVFLVPGSITALFVGRVLSGLSAGVFTATATAMLVDLAPEGRGRRYSLVAAAVNMLGLGLGPVLAGALAEYAPLPLELSYAVHIVLVLLVGMALLLVVDPVGRTVETINWSPQRISIPPQARGTFVRAATAGFAGFAVLGLFTAVSPSFVGQVLHISNHLVTGLVVFALLGSSTVGQVASASITERRALLVGALALVVGVAVVGTSVGVGSLLLLVVGAVVAGLGQGMSFRAGLGEVTANSPAAQRGEVSASFFLVLYIGIAVPVIGVGVLAQLTSLVVAGVAFSAVVAALAAAAFVSLVIAGSRDRTPAT